MPITRIGKFLESEDLGKTHSLGIESAQLKACLRAVKRRNIRGIFGSPVFGFKEDTLDFIRDIPEVTQVWFWAIKLDNIDGLYALENLDYFGVSEKRPRIDFSRFPQLEIAVWHPVRGDQGIERREKLKRLDIWRYKDKQKSYSALQLPENIQHLDLIWCNPDSLQALPTMPALQELQIHYCRNLNTLDPVLQVAPNLKRLVVTRCANIGNVDSLLVRDWERLYINVRGKTLADRPGRPGRSTTS